MSDRIGAAACLAALFVATAGLTACDRQEVRGADDANRQESQNGSVNNVSANSARVERGAEHASAQVAAGVTALAEGVKKGVKEGAEVGRREADRGDATVTQRTTQNGDTTTTTTTTDRRAAEHRY